MNRSPSHAARIRTLAGAPRGFTLVEAALSTVVLSVMTIASMNLVAGAVKTRTLVSNQSGAMLLATQLVEEIAALPYAEPSGGSTTLGVDAGERQDQPTRASLDDIDDYNGFIDSPLRDRMGTSVSADVSIRRTVVVEYLNPIDPQLTSVTDQGLKRITVTVTKSGKPVGTARAVRARSVDLLRAREDSTWNDTGMASTTTSTPGGSGAGSGGGSGSAPAAALPTYSYSASRALF